MKKEEGILDRENIDLLNQSMKSLEEAELKLEEAYEKKEYERFDKIKKFILEIESKIGEIAK